MFLTSSWNPFYLKCKAESFVLAQVAHHHKMDSQGTKGIAALAFAYTEYELFLLECKK